MHLFYHYIYEFRKGVRDMILCTLSSESEEKNSLPINETFIEELWAKIVFQLNKVDAKDVSEEPGFDKFIISLTPKANYFLSQDLDKMTELDEDGLLETSLAPWSIPDDEMTYEYDVSDDGNSDLFFPFPYDRHQLKILGITDNKAIIVEGPPGTGKSQTIANLLVHLAATGKRVLFVSQKDQAVRGVKDKLKSLKTSNGESIPFLFGYIPDRTSVLHTEDDERDSAANTLIALNQSWSKVSVSTPAEPLKTLSNDKTMYVDGIESERSLFKLYQSRRKLDYVSGFINSKVNIEWWKQYIKAKEAVNLKSNIITEYESNNKRFITTKQKSYRNLSIVSTDIKDMITSVVTSFSSIVPERPGLLSKAVTNIKLGQAIKRVTKDMPTEVYNDIISITDSEKTKTERLVDLKSLNKYFEYLVNLEKFDQLNENLSSIITDSNLSQSQLAQLEKSVTEYGNKVFDDVKEYKKIQLQIDNTESFSANELNSEIKEVKKYYQKNVCDYIRNIILNRVHKLESVQHTRATLKRVAKALTRSKRAYKTFDKMKSDTGNFEVMSEILPIWMMSLDDVSRIIPMEANLFDYVILDEASQCNIAYALPVMYRAKHAIFFGDSLQMRDTNTLFKSNEQLNAIAKKHKIPEFYQIKAEEDTVKSVMDIASLAGFKTATLRNHYRSPKELIGFSNENFYAKVKRPLEIINDNILTYKNTNRVLVNHIIDYDQTLDESSKTNMSEAKYIKKIIADIKQDPASANKSIAVLTFFNEQAELLRREIDDEDVKVAIIEGIQGDERDICIYSFVITSPEDKKRYVALTGEGGAIRRSANEGRINVAFSRARLQVHCVTCLDPKLWPDGIWIKRYLEYVDHSGKVIRAGSADEQRFDSKFERDVFNMLSKRLDGERYYLETQVKSCGFRIDLVITDKTTSRKLAIECDGPTHFEPGDGQIYVKDDWERQYALETAGWDFYRLPYSDWQEDRSKEEDKFIDYVNKYFSGNYIEKKPDTVKGLEATKEVPEEPKKPIYKPQDNDSEINVINKDREAILASALLAYDIGGALGSESKAIMLDGSIINLSENHGEGSLKLLPIKLSAGRLSSVKELAKTLLTNEFGNDDEYLDMWEIAYINSGNESKVLHNSEVSSRIKRIIDLITSQDPEPKLKPQPKPKSHNAKSNKESKTQFSVGDRGVDQKSFEQYLLQQSKNNQPIQIRYQSMRKNSANRWRTLYVFSFDDVYIRATTEPGEMAYNYRRDRVVEFK